MNEKTDLKKKVLIAEDDPISRRLLEAFLTRWGYEVAVATSGTEALQALDYGEARVATALNGEFVPARARAATPVKEGDRIEIVAPRQGG